MRRDVGRSAVTVLVAIGVMGALAASASADSVTCGMSSKIRLEPGLTETPHQQFIELRGGKLSECSGDTKATKAEFGAGMRTAEPVTCAALRGTGAAVLTQQFVIRWALPLGAESLSEDFSMPLTETTVSLGGTMTNFHGEAFSEDKISGTATQKYKGTCSARRKIKRGTFTGSITISE
jgi:hypothetical protein